MNGTRLRGAARVAAGVIVLVGAHSQVAHAGAKKVYTLPPTVSVLERSLALKNKETSKTEDLVAEYVPAAESLDHWTLMFAVRIFNGKLTPAQAAQMKEGEVAARREQGDPMARSMSFSKSDTRLVDFVMSQNPIVEHNVMTFQTLPDGRLVSYQLARRYYMPGGEVDDGLRAFMGEIKAKRDVYVKEVEQRSADLLK
jgi:hypothetical protein